MGFRNQSQGGSTGISMSVGPSLTTGLQNAFPIDVVPYGGVKIVGDQLNDDGIIPVFVTPPPAGFLYSLRRFVCMPSAGLFAVLFDPVTTDPYSYATPSQPVDNCMGQLVATALSVQIVGNTTPTPVLLSYDVVLIPTIS